MGQKGSPKFGKTICYGQNWPERVTETRQYDLLQLPSLGGSVWPTFGRNKSYCQVLVALSGPCFGRNKSYYRVSVAFSCPRLVVTYCRISGALSGPRPNKSYCLFLMATAKSWAEKATETRQYDLLRPNVGRKEPPRLGSKICYGATWATKSHQDSAVRLETTKCGPERATQTRQYSQEC